VIKWKVVCCFCWIRRSLLIGRILQYSLDLLNGLACISLLNGLVCISLLNGLHLTAKRFGLHLTVKRFGVHLTVKRLCLHNCLTGQAVCQSAISDPFRLITYRIRLKRDIQWNVWSVECETYIKQALKVLIVKQIISFIPISLKSDLSLAPRPLPLLSYRGYQISHILPFTVISWLSDLFSSEMQAKPFNRSRLYCNIRPFKTNFFSSINTYVIIKRNIIICTCKSC
jgi:hypothetical protein